MAKVRRVFGVWKRVNSARTRSRVDPCYIVPMNLILRACCTHLSQSSSMPLSVGGGQLPISAFFGSSAPSTSRRTGKTDNPMIPPGKRKDPPAATDQHTEPPKKKKAKQKENLTPSKRGSSLNKSEYLEDGTSSQARRSPIGKPTGGEKMTVDVAKNSEVDTPLSTVVDDYHANIAWGSSPSIPTHGECNDQQSPLNVLARLDTPPLTPVRIECRRDVLSSNSLPSPPLTAPNNKRPRKTSDAEVSHPAGAVLQPALHPSAAAPIRTWFRQSSLIRNSYCSLRRTPLFQWHCFRKKRQRPIHCATTSKQPRAYATSTSSSQGISTTHDVNAQFALSEAVFGGLGPVFSDARAMHFRGRGFTGCAFVGMRSTDGVGLRVASCTQLTEPREGARDPSLTARQQAENAIVSSPN